MRCRCPVCRQTTDYPERYAGKWHRCAAGCGPGVGTRMVLVRDGTGVAERSVFENWQQETSRSRATRLVVGLLGAALILLPFTKSIPRPLSLAAAGLGAIVFLAVAKQADPSKPSGLSS